MPEAVPFIMLAMTGASMGMAAAQISKGMPSMPTPPPPPDAAAGEQSAQAAGQKAKRQTMTAIGTSSGRGSTILTGGKLGELTPGDGSPKTLLGS